jgi:hypothetical protein
MVDHPVNINLEEDREDKTSIQKGFRVLLSHVKQRRDTLGIDNGENTELSIKWNNLKLLIYSYKEAHLECREINNFFDKLLTICALVTSFITTLLLALKDVKKKHEGYIYIIECITSGVATFMVGLSNVYDNAGKREVHNGVVVKLRTLAIETKNLSETERTKNDMDIYQECYKNFSDSLGNTHIYPEVRKKYGLDDKYLLS